jgi:hypothetical protein
MEIHVKIIVYWVLSFIGNVSVGMGITNCYHMVLIDSRPGEICDSSAQLILQENVIVTEDSCLVVCGYKGILKITHEMPLD